jgi:zinc protease
MTYTESTTKGAFHTVRVTPLDASIVRFAFTVRVPSYRESVSDALLSLYTALVLTKTEKKNKEAIEMYLKRHGIQLKISAGAGSITYKGNVRKENVPHVVKLLQELIFSPSIDTKELELKKKLLKEDNRESRDDAKRIARIAFSNTLYPRESWFREETLDEELASVSKLAKKPLSLLHALIPIGEWFFTVTGDEATVKAFEPLTKALTKNASNVPREVHESRILDARGAFVTVPGKTNVEVRIGNIIPITPDDEAYTALSFGLAVLGKVGGFSGRLMSTVREKEGLTYGIYATTVQTHRRNSLHWNIFTFFTAKDLKKGVESTLRELTAIIEKGITERELSTFKEILFNQHILSHESNKSRLACYHGLSLLGYTEKEVNEMNELMKKLTTKEVQAALKKYIDPSKLIIVGAGPVREDGTGITT